MRVMKRNGAEVPFDSQKIARAIHGANNELPDSQRMSAKRVNDVVEAVVAKCGALGRTLGVEEIQELVETELMAAGAYEAAKRYIRYRYEHMMRRASNTTDNAILSLVEYENEDIKQENSNKNPEIIPTQRDYIAGEVSKDISRRKILPADVMQAHDLGLIQVHDRDYMIHHSHNCDLVNLSDMLQNGTVISGTLIEKPHTFSTACNIATQIIAQVASCQYGGQTISMAQLAPFVQDTREKLRREYRDTLSSHMSEEAFNSVIEQMVKKDIEKGIQTIQYQVVTLMTTNGQAPFLSVFLDINEVDGKAVQKDLAYIIEEVLRQRIQGVKNEDGQWVTPAFPKLLYALDENNTKEGSEFFYLTKLAAECTAKRMVPDYISRKIMKELKGDVYPCIN